MKIDFKKPIAIILVIVFCAAATVTGFAVSAASHSNAAYDPASTADEKTTDFSKPALKDGVWQAVYEDGHSLYFFINEEMDSFSLIHPEKGIGIPSRYDYISAIGMYKLYAGSVDNELDWRVIDNNGVTAAVSDENGEIISLYYISDETIDSYTYYTYEELCEMAQAYYEAQHGSAEDVSFSAMLQPDGTGMVVITGEQGAEQVITLTVDIQTGIGTDNLGNTVDLSVYAI